MLKIQHLTKKYGDKVAVDDLSLEIAHGEVYGFIGHNGAGKTTTIKCCVGLLDFDAGEIYIDGISIRDDLMACKKKIAYIPDNPVLFEYLSGIDYLNFVADVYHIDKEIRQHKIRQYADIFELTADLAQPISTYSHGMKQKLAIIAAFKFKELMREVCDKGGAVFFSTHVLDVAEKLCDKIAIIKNGKLIRTGTMEEVKGDASLEETFLELEKDANV